MVIESSQLTRSLEFGEVQGEFIAVSLSSEDHSATKEVSLYMDPEGIATLLAKAAADWRGWTGVRRWKSLSGDLTLGLTHDGLGHVTLSVLLQSHDWSLESELDLEAGALREIARRAAEHFAVASS